MTIQHVNIALLGRDGIETGVFDLFSSNHCPFRYDDPHGKLSPDGQKSFRWIPNGIPGVETRLPILFSEGVTNNRIDLQRFVALSSTNHAQLYGLYPRKGLIAVGSDADIVIWDAEKSGPIQQANLHHGADYTPHEGLHLQGWPILSMLRGTVVMEEPSDAPPVGMHLARNRSSMVTAPAKASLG